ncbi:YbaB/EbfC family nucleoid-associated protein [Nocardia beijingensis]|uniref:YbaB/EbfC family nucleoid-associated protein n=1 Tax=Nocardia beijingensis TaxID=95162 RepID=UPI0033B0FD2F
MTDFAALESGALTQLDRMRGLAAALEAIRVERTDPRGDVTVGVDGMGRLVKVILAHSVSQLSPREFERAVVDTAAAAARQALATRARLIEEFNGG